jgi:hypothetical protein
MKLKSTVTEGEDFRLFQNFLISNNSLVNLFFDSKSEFRGFFVYHKETVDLESNYSVLVPEFGFLDQSFRGNPLFILSIYKAAIEFIRSDFFRKKYLYLPCYPDSFILCRNLMGGLIHFKTPKAEKEKALLMYLCKKFAQERFSEQTQVINMRTIPPEIQSRSMFKYKSLIDEYEALNPFWKEGYSLPTLGKMEAKDLLAGCYKILKRMVHFSSRKLQTE